MANLKKKLIGAGIVVGTFGLLTLLVYYICAPSLCFLENTATYINHSGINAAMLSMPGGCVHVMALWLQQWFVSPIASALVTGAILSVIVLSLDNIITLVGRRRGLFPLALLPALALIYAHTDIDYRLSATVAMAMATVFLVPVAAVRNAWIRLCLSVAGCAVLYIAAGPASVLFAVESAIISLGSDGRKGLFTIACLPVSLGLAYLGYAQGAWTSLENAILPWGYFPHWHHAVAGDLLPWTALTAVLLLAVIVKYWLPASAKRPIKSWVITASSLIITACIFGKAIYTYGFPNNSSFATMWLLASNQEWDEIAAVYKYVDKEDGTMQNFLNLALAEKGTLCDYLFWHPNNGVAALHNSENKSPYTYMLLSDIYYSMGFIALSKRYAFEANEALGNASPQMLMRLADTNIITGDYAVAAKYLDMLALTSRYSSWANGRRHLLYNDDAVAADPILSMKRGCLFPDNRFAGINGIADDMLQVLRCNPSHTSTMQYLGAYYMLSRNIPGLICLIDEFRGTQALGLPLPTHFQEAVVIDGLISGNGIDGRYNIHPSVLDRCRAFWAEHKPQPNTLWHYLRQK